MTQADRVLRRLHYGPISPYDFLQPVIDGGKPILRVAARVQDLRDRGYHISTTTAANGTAIYELIQSEAQEAVVPAPEGSPLLRESRLAVNGFLGSDSRPKGSDDAAGKLPSSDPPLFAVDDHNYRDEVA